MKFYLIAGEASGDMHGANLVKEMSLLEPEAKFRAWGGDRLKAEGAQVVKHIRELAFMGFAEVLMNIRTIKKNFDFCQADITSYGPDALILIDYPGFNLRMAKWAHQKGIKVFYYISPQVWAWKKNRVEKIRKYVDHMYVILPFEKQWYADQGVEVEFVGHPLLDEISSFQRKKSVSLSSEKNILAALPGSRKQEVSKMLPIMLQMCGHFPDHQVLVAAAPTLDDSFYKPLLNGHPARLVHDKTYSLLNSADMAMVTSGTATLETALFGVPEVVCYKGNPISYSIARKVVNIEYISLVNLIMNKEVVKELIQRELNPVNLRKELMRISEGSKEREVLVKELETLKAELGGSGASRKTAELMLKSL